MDVTQALLAPAPHATTGNTGNHREALGAQRHSTATTSIGSDNPFSITLRGAEVVTWLSATVATLAKISPPVARAAIRAASCTPFPLNEVPACVASEACRPIRICGA